MLLILLLISEMFLFGEFLPFVLGCEIRDSFTRSAESSALPGRTELRYYFSPSYPAGPNKSFGFKSLAILSIMPVSGDNCSITLCFYSFLLFLSVLST